MKNGRNRKEEEENRINPVKSALGGPRGKNNLVVTSNLSAGIF